MKRVLTSLAFATLAGALVFGAAASLTVTSQELGSGDGDVQSCDTDVSVTFVVDSTDPSTVTEIAVSGIDDSACNGQTVYYRAEDFEGTSLATGNSPYTTGDGGTKTFTGLSIDASQLENVVVTIAG